MYRHVLAPTEGSGDISALPLGGIFSANFDTSCHSVNWIIVHVAGVVGLFVFLNLVLGCMLCVVYCLFLCPKLFYIKNVCNV